MMNVPVPEFFKKGYLIVTDEGFELKPNAPPEVVKEFNDFMDSYKKNEEEGVMI